MTGCSCSKCSKPIAGEGFELGPNQPVCLGCFMEAASKIKSITGDERKRLKRAVDEELAGLLPRQALCSRYSPHGLLIFPFAEP